MRFLSRYGRFGVQITPKIEEHFATGIARTIQEPVYVMFHTEGITMEERELALDRWRGSWNGFYQQEDEVTIVPPDYRIGVFDSVQAQFDNGWSDELRFQVEGTLIDMADRFGDMYPIPLVLVPPPWPRYDEYTGSPKALIRKLLDEGYDFNTVLVYELENQNRPLVIAELEEAIAGPSAEPQAEEVLG